MVAGKMFRPARLSWLLAPLLGCEEQPVTYEVQPFEGEAFPDRLAPLDYPESAGLVTNSLSDTLSVLDLGSMEVLATRPVGRNPVDVDGPHHVTIDEVDGHAYIALSYPASQIVLGPHATHGSSASYGWVQKLRLEDLSVVAQIRVEPNPGDIVMSPDRRFIAVSHFDLQRAIEHPDDIGKARSSVAVIDRETFGEPGAKPTFITTCVAAHGMVFGPGGELYVACYGEDNVAVIDLSKDELVPDFLELGDGAGTFGAPNYGPYALTMSPDGAWLVVSNTVSNDVRFIETATGLVDSSRTLFTNAAPFFPTFANDGRTLAVVTQQPDTLRLVDMEGELDDEVKTFLGDECPLPHVVMAEKRLSGDEEFVVVCEGDKKSNGRVVRLSKDLETLGAVEVGIYPDAITKVGQKP